METGVEIGADDFVDQGTGLSQTGMGDVPLDATTLARPGDEAVAVQQGEVLGDVGPADAEQLGELVGELGFSQSRWKSS